MLNNIQANIKKRLNKKNMSAAELERRTGIPHAVVNILHGRSKNPSIRTTQAIAKELGCSLEELLSDPQSDPHTKEFSNNTSWIPAIYKQAFTAVYEHIQKQQLNPKATLVSSCITDVYMYTIGSPEKTIDQRFVHWIIEKHFTDPDNKNLS